MKKLGLALLVLVYAVLWIGGVGGHVLFGGTPANMSWTAPVFLVAASGLVLIGSRGDRRMLLLVACAGFAAEVVGSKSGVPFGRYAFTATLAPSLFGVPLVMGGAWMIVVAYVSQWGLAAWAGALLMTAIDLLIDPVSASALGFWRWDMPGIYYGIPISNYAGWLLVSFVLLIALPKQSGRSELVLATGASVLAFFSCVAFAHRLYFPGALGAVICLTGYLRFKSSSVSTSI